MSDLNIFSALWFLIAGIIVFSAFIRATTGFGQNLAMVPILLWILDPKSAVTLGILLGMISSLAMLPFCYKQVDWQKVAPMIIGSLIGIPAGIYVILLINAATLKILIGGLCIILAVPMAFGFTLPLRRENIISGLVGCLSGFLTPTTSIGGPPVALYMHNQKWNKEVIRANLNIIFVIAGLITISSLFITGVLNWSDLLKSFSFIPALAIGIGIGMLVFPHLSSRVFRIISMVIVVVAGISGVLSGSGIM
jgi:uncharacterized membrane protein YfcA